jgi:hypothetical protein
MKTVKQQAPTDLTYRKDGLWVSFMPETRAAESVWAQIVPPAPFDRDGEGRKIHGSCLCIQLDAYLKSLRKAGWTVRAKLLPSEQAARDALALDAMSDEDLLAELREGVAA